jgi:cytochrome oxidase Cu insertion factor (SCO1/SenC/PrrC family)
MNEQEKTRRRKLAVLAVVVPVLVGIGIVLIGHLLGHETEIKKPKELSAIEAEAESTEPRRTTAPAPAEAGTPAPRVRLTNGATGQSFDSASIGDDPYAVVFVNTGCEAIGKYLGRVASELKAKGDAEAVLAISADPSVDTPEAVTAWVGEHKLKDGPVHYLVGSEAELKGLWNAWGFGGPSPACPPSIPAHLVDGAGENDGVVDLDPAGPSSLLVDALVGMAK